MNDDLHEVQFKWPSAEARVVIVTGTFDEWSSSVHLVKNENGFTGSVRIPWDTKIYYKYVVDSEWICESTSPTETDWSGNVNNVYTSPQKPPADASVVTNGAIATENLEPTAAAPAGAASADQTATAEAQEGSTFSQIASDFAETVVAADGTTSALGYVASALGAAIQSQIGVDPINGAKIVVETPKPDAQFIIPEPPAVEASLSQELCPPLKQQPHQHTLLCPLPSPLLQWSLPPVRPLRPKLHRRRPKSLSRRRRRLKIKSTRRLLFRRPLNLLQIRRRPRLY
ncbi:hypothetical protein K438DRAFT_43069 [Mycena galopus ATCC 62051]|nr:hypothetical protein K438DRAFT_43069 [Mycena galopus ATCC 62051]